ncbi:hypothetical protein VTI74DRAFT_6206 [Chaetomium olivicolor]
MDARYQYGPVGQPGLEVAAHEPPHHVHPFPEVRADEYSNGGKEPVFIGYSDDPEHYYVPAGAHPHGPSEVASQSKAKRKKRLWIIIGVTIAIVVIVAAVLGGVLGGRAAKSSGEPTASQTGGNGNQNNTGNRTDTPSNTTTGPLFIRQGSSLSVTGWRRPEGSVETFLFYQDQHNALRYSRCDTNLRTPGNDSSCWQETVTFNSFANASARLAASTLLWGNHYAPQIELFYTGFKNRLLGISFNPLDTPSVSEDSINKVNIFTNLNTSLTAYWPWTIYQDPTGVLYHVRNLLGGNFRPSSQWDNNRINITAITASRLAIVPMSASFRRIAVKGGYAIFYQDVNEKLAVTVTDLNSPQLAKDYPLSWPTTVPDITLPKLAPMAGFSVARKGDESQRVDTYLLYLDGSANINVLYTALSGSSVEWKMAQPEALKRADPETDIACLTMASTFQNASEAETLLAEASDDTMRCYFQREGKLVEVKLDLKGEWSVVGTVPI